MACEKENVYNAACYAIAKEQWISSTGLDGSCVLLTGPDTGICSTRMMSNTVNYPEPNRQSELGRVNRALAVDFRAVYLSYGSTPVLNGIDFMVCEGERVVIIGPSGSGKTTLIRCFNGLEVPQSGSMRIFGRDLRSEPDALKATRRDVAMLFQSFNLYSNKTVLRNVSLAPMRVFGMPRKEAEARAMAEIERVGVAECAHRYPFEISVGQQQRVAVARALVMKPKLFLLDEPTSALDPELVNSVGEMLTSIAAMEGMTFVCITHALGFARSIADRIVFMSEGKVVAEGQPDMMLDNSSNVQVRAFMNAVR